MSCLELWVGLSCLCNNLKPIDGGGDVVGEGVGGVPDSVAVMTVEAAGRGVGEGEAEDGEL